MPRVWRTIVPRIRKSLREQGVVRSLYRSVLLPGHLIREYRASKKLAPIGPSEFDIQHQVDTDGDLSDWTYLSDLTIASENWIYGRDYAPIEPERFADVMAQLPVSPAGFAFVDFGSGKGRALLLASEYPFRRIIGLEFAKELHEAAQKNIRGYSSPKQQCREIESVCVDFTEYELPLEPCVLFFFDPCEGRVLEEVAAEVQKSLRGQPREVYVLYVAPKFQHVFESASWELVVADYERQFCIYRANRSMG